MDRKTCWGEGGRVQDRRELAEIGHYTFSHRSDFRMKGPDGFEGKKKLEHSSKNVQLFFFFFVLVTCFSFYTIKSICSMWFFFMILMCDIKYLFDIFSIKKLFLKNTLHQKILNMF